MKRRLLSVLLAVAMLAASFVALPVFAATENFDSIDVPLNKDSQVDFSQGYTGTVTVKFDLTVSAGTGNMRIWLPIHGNDRMGTANPMFSVNESGTIYAQQTIEIARTTPGSTVSIEWVYNCAAGTYTLAVNGGAPSGDINCGAQANVGALAYKVITEKTATIANLTVTGETGEPDVPDLPMNINDRKFYEFDDTYTGLVTVDFDLNINSGSRFELWLEPAEQAGWENASNPYLQFTAEGDLWLQNSAKVTRLAQGIENHFQIVVNLATKEYTIAINGGAAYGPVAFAGDMANIGGFDYRMQNTTGYIDNIQVSGVAVPEAPFDYKVNASIVGEETVVYDDDVTYDLVLSKVENLNVLTLAFEYDPAVLTFDDILLAYDNLDELLPLGVDEEAGLISAVYGVKNEAITAGDDTVWATLVFKSVEPGAEGVDATVELTHFTSSGLIEDGSNAKQFETTIEVPSATTKVVLPKPTTFAVGGAITNYLIDAEEITFELWAEAADAAAYTATVAGDSTSYSIADVLPGNYTLKVAADNGVTREYAVTVADADVTQDVTLFLKGDVNLDGSVDMKDAAALQRHVLKAETITNPDSLAAADVEADGAVDMKDAAKLKQYVLKAIDTLD